jgi:hypothetical protein
MNGDKSIESNTVAKEDTATQQVGCGFTGQGFESQHPIYDFLKKVDGSARTKRIIKKHLEKFGNSSTVLAVPNSRATFKGVSFDHFDRGLIYEMHKTLHDTITSSTISDNTTSHVMTFLDVFMLFSEKQLTKYLATLNNKPLVLVDTCVDSSLTEKNTETYYIEIGLVIKNRVKLALVHQNTYFQSPSKYKAGIKIQSHVTI